MRAAPRFYSVRMKPVYASVEQIQLFVPIVLSTVVFISILQSGA